MPVLPAAFAAGLLVLLAIVPGAEGPASLPAPRPAPSPPPVRDTAQPAADTPFGRIEAPCHRRTGDGTTRRTGVAITACLMPAVRGTRATPLVALRRD